MAARAPDLDAYRHDVEAHLRAPGPAADERFAHLFSVDAVAGLSAAAEAAGGEAARRRLRALARHAAEGHLRIAAAAESGALAEELRDATAAVDGEELGLADLGARVADEPDPARRRSLQAERLRLIEARLGTHLSEARERWAEAAAEAGAASPEAFVAAAAGLDLPGLAADADRFLDETSDLHGRLLDAALREATGGGLAGADSSDLPRVAAAPAAGMGPDPGAAPAAALRTAELLGVDPGRVPQPPAAEGPGITGAAGVLRATGAALLLAGASPRRPVEERLLGDPAIARAHAHLWEGLLAEPRWLVRVLGADDPEPVARAAAALRLLAARLAAGRVVEAVRPDEDALSRAAGLPWPEAFRASDRSGPALGPADDLRGWALAGVIRAHLHEGMGPAWFADPRAGALLSELWAEGPDPDPAELARDLGGEGLDPGSLTAEAAEALGAGGA